MSRILTGVAAALLACGAHAQVLGFGSPPQGQIGYNRARRSPVYGGGRGVESRVQPYSDRAACLRWQFRRSSISPCATCWRSRRRPRVKGLRGRKQANLRRAGSDLPALLEHFVRKDSPIKSLAELKATISLTASPPK